MTDDSRRTEADKPRVDDFFTDPANRSEKDVPEPEAIDPDASDTHVSNADGSDADGSDADGSDADGSDADLARQPDAEHRAGGPEGGPQEGAADRPRGRTFAPWQRTAGRWSRTVALAAAAAGMVTAATLSPVLSFDLATALGRPDTTSTAGGEHAGLAAVTDTTLGCVGPDLVGLDDPTVAEPDQSVSVFAAQAPEQARGQLPSTPEDGQAELVIVDGQDADPTAGTDQATSEQATDGAHSQLDVAGAQWVRASATDAIAPGFAASQAGLDLTEQQRGLTVAACLPATEDAWFLAGGSEPGRAERLILANPTGNPVTADVQILGADGPVDAIGGRGVVVAPGARQVLLLDALAPGEERPVVHLSTTGGSVVAALGDRWLEGTLDRGTELTTPAAAPATELLIPAATGPRADSADSTVLRVGVPGTEQAVVQVRALTVEGPTRLDNGVTTVEAGAVADIDISDLPEGTHALEVIADTPVVASALVIRRAEPEGVGEFAWVPAAEASTDLVGLPLGQVGENPLTRQVSIASSDGATVEVVTVPNGADASPSTQTVQVPAAGNAVIEVAAEAESVWVRTVEGSAAAGLLTTVDDEQGSLIAGTVLPEAPLTHQVRPVAPWRP